MLPRTLLLNALAAMTFFVFVLPTWTAPAAKTKGEKSITNRLVRCEVDLDRDKIRFFTLRRKEPTSQPQILEVDYRLPNRGFQD